jgi:glycosyltransferase involved in cell wall biosynthesis
MAGLPILSTNQPPLEKMVKEFQVGKLVREKDPPEYIAALIKDLAKNKTVFKKNLSKYAETFSWEEEATRVEKSIARLINNYEVTDEY